VLELVSDIEPHGRRALDVSCKRGDLIRHLAARGFEVRGTNFERGSAPIEGLPVDDGIDLMRGLPYPEESFDLVLLTEVIEHLENHRAAIAELARVLKPGGTLVLTTPNIMRLNSRLAFLLSGFHKAKRRLMPLDTPLEKAHRFHNYPITFPLLYYLLKAHGLKLDTLGHSQIKTISYLLFYLLYPIIAANTAFRLLKRDQRGESRELNQELKDWMLNRRLLLEDTLLIRASKPA
jgi:SAM-dependent methyltransferase